MKKKTLQGLWLSVIILFLYLPIFILAVYSFTESTMIGSIRGFSLKNYITLLTTPELQHMIRNTFVLAFVVSVISVVLGTLGAVGAFYSRSRFQKTMEFANQIPVVNADVVTGFSVCILLIVFFGMNKDTYLPLVIGQTVLCTPFVFLSVMPRLRQMDPYLYEAALDLGCTPFQALWKVVFRELLPGVMSGFVTAVTLSLDDYFITTYTKPAVFDTISTYVVNATKGAQTSIKTALWALSALIFLLVVLAVLLMNVRPKGKKRERSGSGYRYLRCLLLVVVTAGIASSFCGCGQEEEDVVVLRVANSEEYIDEGGWDEDETIELGDGVSVIGKNSMVEDFETWYEQTYGEKVRVEYSTYGTNEELYNQMTLGDTFDVVCPSEYMIMKFMSEHRLQEFSEAFFDETVEENYYIRGVSPYIRSVFRDLKVEEEELSRFGAGYMWGVMGIVYNPEKVSGEAASHWSMLTDPTYYKQVTMKDSVRDSYFIGLAILYEEELLQPSFLQNKEYNNMLSQRLNDTRQETVDKVEEILSDMRKNSYSLETDSGKADLVTGKVVANMQWSGDAVYTLDQAEEDGIRLDYSVPLEGSNLWFDGWCMMKEGLTEDPGKQRAAEAWINFLSRPDNVVRNMHYIGYTSVIAGGESNVIYDYADYCFGAEEDSEDTTEYSLAYFFGNEGDHVLTVEQDQLKRQLYAQYPPDDVLRRTAVMMSFSDEVNKRISQMWINIRCFDW